MKKKLVFKKSNKIFLNATLPNCGELLKLLTTKLWKKFLRVAEGNDLGYGENVKRC